LDAFSYPEIPISSNSTVRAELYGCTTAKAGNVTAVSSSPVLHLCRRLLEVGLDPAQPLHAYRGDTLCLLVRSLADGAALEVNAHGTGLITAPDGRRRPVARLSGQEGTKEDSVAPGGLLNPFAGGTP
jgi:hypothetical protein